MGRSSIEGDAGRGTGREGGGDVGRTRYPNTINAANVQRIQPPGRCLLKYDSLAVHKP